MKHLVGNIITNPATRTECLILDVIPSIDPNDPTLYQLQEYKELKDISAWGDSVPADAEMLLGRIYSGHNSIRLLAEAEQDAISYRERETKKKLELEKKVREVSNELTIATLAIGKHEKFVGELKKEIIIQNQDYADLRDEKKTNSFSEINLLEDQLAAEKLAHSDLKREVTKLRSTDYQKSLQQNLKIQHYTLTGVEPRLMDAEIAQRRSDGWEVVNYSDIPLYHTEGQDEIKAHYSYRHIVRFEKFNSVFVPENHIVAVVGVPEVFDKAIVEVLGKNDGSHIGALTSPTMADVADVIFAPIPDEDKIDNRWNMSLPPGKERKDSE